jgi:F0F1-type ATP synthase membrane subunit b/b'
MQSLEGESRRAMEEAARQYERLLTDLRAQAEAMRQRGQDAAARALEELMEALRRALDTRRDEVIET